MTSFNREVKLLNDVWVFRNIRILETNISELNGSLLDLADLITFILDDIFLLNKLEDLFDIDHRLSDPSPEGSQEVERLVDLKEVCVDKDERSDGDVSFI